MNSDLDSNITIKKILIVEANPRRDINLNEEIRDLQDAIQASRDREYFLIKVGLAVRSTDLHKLILEFEPNIVHFCGHGSGEAGLVFLDKKIDTDALSNLFELCKEHVECVVLNACYSEVQANEIVKHVQYVMGMNQRIRDDAAIAFSIGFYRALGYGRSIEDAYKFGCNAIQLTIDDRSTQRDVIAEEMRKLVVVDPIPSKNIPEHLKPVLRQRRKKAEEIPGFLKTHYQELTNAIIKGSIVPFLGADINLCDRPSEEKDSRPYKWNKEGPYPPTNLELAAYIDSETRYIDEEGRGYLKKVGCPLFPGSSLDLPKDCPILTRRFTRLDLLRVSQYFQSREESDKLKDSIKSIYQQSSYQFNTLHKFLVRLIRDVYPLIKKVHPVDTEKPGTHATDYPLIVTTCFDRTLERAFENESLSFDLISYTSSEEDFIYQKFGTQDKSGTVSWTKGERISKIISDKKEPSWLTERPVILRLYGPVTWESEKSGENFAITEDYFLDYLACEIHDKLPTKLWSKLLNSRLWFLGYSLSYWNLRFIIRKIRKEAKPNIRKWWAIQEKADILDRDLWKRNHVNFFSDRQIGSLEKYLKEVDEQLTDDLNKLPQPRSAKR